MEITLLMALFILVLNDFELVMDAICKGEFFCSNFFKTSSIVLSSSKRGRMMILIPIFWCLQNNWIILIFFQWENFSTLQKAIERRKRKSKAVDTYNSNTGRSIDRTDIERSYRTKNIITGLPKQLKWLFKLSVRFRTQASEVSDVRYS